MKRAILCLFLSMLLLPFTGSAESDDSTTFDLKSLAEDTVLLVNINDPTHEVLGLAHNADTKRYPASTTKILTCIVALEQGDPDEWVTVSKRACDLSERNSKMGLKPKEQYKLIDLLYGLMLPSGNDAAIAIAEHLGGSISDFAALMNEKAAQLGMEHSHFVNPHGLHNAEHYTTARDMAILSAYAMQNPVFSEIVGTVEHVAESKDGRKITLLSSNRLLRDVTANSYKPYSCLYDYAIGIKTGDTHLAGKCLVAAARRGETTYLLILLHGENAPENKKGQEKDKYAAQRFYDAIRLFDYAFRHDTVTLTVSDLIERCLPQTYATELDPARYGAKAVLYRIDWDAEAELTLPRWQADLFAVDPFPEETLCYDIKSYFTPVGSVAGTVSIEYDEQTVFKGNLIVEEYEYPPTPEPTVQPTYLVVEQTPEPSAFVLPTQTPDTTPSPSLWNWFRCNPND